ncbi:MAG: PAS domain S-box protein [Methanoregula sp.]
MLSVLYVDDEEALLDITKIFLESSGELKIDTCSNPKDALYMLGTRTYDVIVSDYEMPELNGIELLKTIKSQNIDTPVIIFTGRGREIVAIDALNNGAAFYLQKGGDPKAQFAELKNIIQRAAEHKQVERKLKLTQFSVDRAYDEVFWIDPKGNFLFVNDAACQSKGYTQAELLSKTIFDINPGYTPLSWTERFGENKIKGSLTYESTHKRKDGSIFPVEITSNYLTFEGKEYFFAFARDISERKQNEMELRASNEQMAAMLEQIQASDESIAHQFTELEHQKKTLFESESRYREIFDNAPLGIFNSTPEGKILRVNQEFARILGYDSPEEITEVVNRSTVHEVLYENPSRRAEYVRDVTSSGKWQHFENRYRKKDGTIVTARLIFRSFINAKTGCRELEGFLEDISAQRRVLDTLEKNEDRFRTLFEKVPLGYQSLDAEGKFIEVNKTWLETMGYSREEIIGHWFSEFLAPDYLEKFRSNFPKFKTAGETTVEFDMIKKDGSRIVVAFEGKCGYDQKGNFTQTHCILQDITERKRVFDQLKESEELFREVFNNANDAIFLQELNSDYSPGIYWKVNDVACRQLGYTRDELLALSLPDIVPHTFLEKNMPDITKQLREKDIATFETVLKKKDGTKFPVEVSTHIFKLKDRAVVLSTARDISDLRRSVEDLQDHENLFREVFNNANDAIVLHEIGRDGMPGRILMVNDIACTKTGYSRDELLKMSATDLVVPTLLPKIEAIAKEAHEKGQALFRTTHQDKQGNTVPVELNVHIFMLQGKPVGLTVVRNISERDKDVSRIHEAMARTETLVRVAARLNASLDPGEVMRGICEETAKTLNAPVVSLYLYDENRQVFVPTADYGILPEFRKFQPTIPRTFYEKNFSDGKRVRVVPDVRQVPDSPGFESDHLTDNRTVIAAIIERKGDLVGMLTAVTFGNIRTFTDADQSLLKGLADETALALTNARLFAEQRNSEDAVLKANKKLNILSSITRHDILNKLTVLRAYMDLMKERVTDPKTYMYIQAQEKAAQAIAQQIDFTKTYQDLGIHQPEWQDINQVIRRSREQLDPKGIQLEIKLNGVSIFADPLIEKVFYNLIDNSIRYGEKITRISLSSKQEPDGFSLIYEDDGIGIPDKDKKRIFERGVGKNTGLGLFLVREILSITGMTIDETGTFGKGARFEIHVPASDIRMQSYP